MKNSRFLRLASLFGLTILSLAGCSTPTAPDSSTSQPPASSEGKTVLTIGAATAPSKTVLPAAPTIAGYTLSVDSGSGFQTLTAFSTVPATASINQGTYDFKLEAADASGKVVLAQVQLGVVVGEPSLNLNFTLSPVTGGPGDVLVNVSWPSTVAVASADTSFGPLGGAATTTAAPIVSNSLTFAQSAVASGNYLLTIRLKDSGGNLLASVIEVVRVFQNLLSTKTITVAALDFNTAPRSPSSVAAAPSGTQVNVTWTDSSNNETGFVLERSTDGGTSWTALTATPLAAGTTSFADTSVTAGLTHRYRVTAVNTFGNSAATVSAPITFFAVTYDGNGSTGGAVPAAALRIVASTVAVQGNTGALVRAGFQLTGWNTAANGTGTSYGLSGATFVMPSANVTLFAVWIPTFTVTYDGNGSTGGAVPTTPPKIAGASVAVLGNTGTLVKTGSQLGGWNTAANGTGTSYGLSGAAFVMPAANVTLFAVWIPAPLTFTSTGASITVTGPATVTGALAIPNGVTSIGNNAFASATSLTSVVFPASLASIGNEAFKSTGLTSVVLPASLTSLGIQAFAFCSQMTAITVNAANPAYQSIGGAVLNKAGTELVEVPSKLTTYSIPASVTKINESAFQGSAVTTISLPAGLTVIGPNAFVQTKFTSVALPSGLTTIGDKAFGLSSLTSVTIPASVTSMGRFVFSQTPNFATISVAAANPNYQSVGGALLNKTGTVLLEVPNGKTTYSIPTGVTAIGDFAFASCMKLTSVTIPTTVTTIGISAFQLCTVLAGVTIPSNVTKLDSLAFFGCVALNNVTIPAAVNTLGFQVFQNCSQLSSVTMLSTAPPALPAGSAAFTGDATTLQIHVPSASLTAYKAAVGWSDFASKIVSP